MKLKSYLRGLGLGMIITTIILVIAFQDRRQNMTDADIVSKAYELGMVETSMFSGNKNETSSVQNETTTASKPTEAATVNMTEASGEGKVDPESTAATEAPTQKPTEKPTTKPTEAPTQKPTEKPTTKPTEAPTQKPTEAPTTKPTEAPTEKPTEKPTEAPTKPAIQEIKLLFEDITSADKASKILYQAGLIQDVEGFNKYLSDKGWATKVGEGEFTFRTNMTFEEIAKIITRQKN